VQSVTICTIVQTCCLFALFYRFVVVYLYCCRNWLFSYCRIDLLFLCYCTDLLLTSVAFPTCCLFLLLNKRAVFMLFSPFQHLSLFLIRICVALLINCKIKFVLPWSTNAPNINRGLRGRDRVVVWFIITCVISD
jgi:hypothetical protein